jgi:hypothetical protein
MKKHGIFALLCLAVLSAITAPAQPFKEHHTESYAVGDQWSVVLHNEAGGISVVGWDQPRVQVDWDITSHSRQGLDVPWVEIATDHQQVDIRTASPITRTKTEKTEVAASGPWCVNYVIHLPRNLRLLELSTMDGDVSISGIQGNIRLSSMTGTVAIEDAMGNLDISTVHARQTLKLAAVSGRRSIRLQSVNGSIRVSLSTKSDVNVLGSTASGGFSNEFGWVPHKRQYEDGTDLRGQLGRGEATLDIQDVNGSVTIAAEKRMR